MPHRPGPRAARQAETRAQIIKAAEQRFLDVGYSRASLDDIAGMAGFSKGAIYSNFSAKEELFLAVSDQRAQQLVNPLLDRLSESPELHAKTVTLYEWLKGLTPEDNRWQLVEAEFQVLAVRDESLRRRLVERNRVGREYFASIFQKHATDAGIDLPMDPVTIADAFAALHNGLAISVAIDPEMKGDHLLAIYRALIGLPMPVGSD